MRATPDRLAGLLVHHADHMETDAGPAKQPHRAKHPRYRRRQGVAEHQSKLGVQPLAGAEHAPVHGLELHRPHSCGVDRWRLRQVRPRAVGLRRHRQAQDPRPASVLGRWRRPLRAGDDGGSQQDQHDADPGPCQDPRPCRAGSALRPRRGRDAGRRARLRRCRPRLGEGPVQHLQQPACVEVEAGRAQLEGLAAHQLGQAVRQLVGTRHPGPIHQDRDDADVARQGRLDLQPHEVVAAVEATPAVFVGDGEPLWTDQRQQHVAGPDRPGDHLDEVVAQLDGVDVLEDLPAAEAVGQPVVQPAGWVGRLLPPVADEDPARPDRDGSSHCPHLPRPNPRHPLVSIIEGASGNAP